MDSFTKLQNSILTTLEEAGEDDLSALINTVGACNGSAGEIESVSKAMEGLIKSGLLQMARSRDASTRRWIRLPREESLDLLSRLPSSVSWSVPDGLWKLHRYVPRTEVLLTPDGVTAARQILSERD